MTRKQMTEQLIIRQTTALNNFEMKQVLALWNSEYPEKLAYPSLTAFEQYLQKLSHLTHYIVTTKENVMLGWALKFERDNEKWFAIIIAEVIKGRGLGRRMVNELKKEEEELHGWVIDHNEDKKINGQDYVSPLSFYEKCGFETLRADRLELDVISAVKIRWSVKKQ
jgi:GNAT superfamily N-acetyltransferase